MLRVVEKLFSLCRTSSGRPVSCQSPDEPLSGLVSCARQALHSVLMPIACESYSFPLAVVDEGQWKGMSFTEDLKEIEKVQSYLLNSSVCL
jgi:hypothetical protein